MKCLQILYTMSKVCMARGAQSGGVVLQGRTLCPLQGGKSLRYMHLSSRMQSGLFCTYHFCIACASRQTGMQMCSSMPCSKVITLSFYSCSTRVKIAMLPILAFKALFKSLHANSQTACRPCDSWLFDDLQQGSCCCAT